MPAPREPRDPRERAVASPPPPRPFPPMITYRALDGQPRLVQVVVATAVLPLEITVSGVRVLHAVESVLVELAAHLRALRPAVTAASDAYATGQFDPVFRTIDRIQHGTDAFAVVWAPITTVREVLAPSRAASRPEPVVEQVVVRPPRGSAVDPDDPDDPDGAAEEEPRGWFSWLIPGR